MNYLLAGALVLGLLIWSGRPGRVLKRPEWRIATAALSVGVFAAAAFVGVRGGWGKAVVLGVIGLGLALSVRWPRSPAVKPGPTETMSVQDARSMLGVGPQATAADIKSAYARLIQLAHPDRGGTDGLAIQLNRARERLLKH